MKPAWMSELCYLTLKASSTEYPLIDYVEHTSELSHWGKLESLGTNSLPNLVRVNSRHTSLALSCSLLFRQTKRKQLIYVGIVYRCLKVNQGYRDGVTTTSTLLPNWSCFCPFKSGLNTVRITESKASHATFMLKIIQHLPKSLQVKTPNTIHKNLQNLIFHYIKNILFMTVLFQICSDFFTQKFF